MPGGAPEPILAGRAASLHAGPGHQARHLGHKDVNVPSGFMSEAAHNAPCSQCSVQSMLPVQCASILAALLSLILESPLLQAIPVVLPQRSGTRRSGTRCGACVSAISKVAAAEADKEGLAAQVLERRKMASEAWFAGHVARLTGALRQGRPAQELAELRAADAAEEAELAAMHTLPLSSADLNLPGLVLLMKAHVQAGPLQHALLYLSVLCVSLSYMKTDAPFIHFAVFKMSVDGCQRTARCLQAVHGRPSIPKACRFGHGWKCASAAMTSTEPP